MKKNLLLKKITDHALILQCVATMSYSSTWQIELLSSFLMYKKLIFFSFLFFCSFFIFLFFLSWPNPTLCASYVLLRYMAKRVTIKSLFSDLMVQTTMYIKLQSQLFVIAVPMSPTQFSSLHFLIHRTLKNKENP